MEIIEFSYPNAPEIKEKISLCLGYFDGVHLGHRSIFASAKKDGYKVGVLTFDNSPAFVLNIISENRYLTSLSDKAELLEECGVDYLLIMHFSKTESQLTKDEFIENVLQKFDVHKIFCGEDYSFGVRGEGTPFYLTFFFDVEVCKTLEIDNKKISSRDIVNFIKEGNIDMANKMLGHSYRLNGIVVEGKHNGDKVFHCPTANLELEYPYVFPKSGVYYGTADIYGKIYKCMIFVGTHPSIMPLSKPIIEVHILEYAGNLYGKNIFINLLGYIRDEKKFDSVEELEKQIKKDISFVENIEIM